MNAVTGVGAPWYTSGVHTWNGTAATLNAEPDEQQGDAGEHEGVVALDGDGAATAWRPSSEMFVEPMAP